MDSGYFGNISYQISGTNTRYVSEILSASVNGFNIPLEPLPFLNLCFMRKYHETIEFNSQIRFNMALA